VATSDRDVDTGNPRGADELRQILVKSARNDQNRIAGGRVREGVREGLVRRLGASAVV